MGKLYLFSSLFVSFTKNFNTCYPPCLLLDQRRQLSPKRLIGIIRASDSAERAKVKCSIANEQCRRGAHLPVYAVSPLLDRPLKSVTHGQCDARPTVTFPAAGHHRTLTGAKFTAWRQRHVCEQLAQGCYLKAEQPGVEPATFGVTSPNYALTIRHSLEMCGANDRHECCQYCGSAAEWLACWTQAQKGPGSNRSRDHLCP